MSRFYGALNGRGDTSSSRCGTKTTGLWGHLRGWKCGVEVRAYVGDENVDTFDISITSGSDGSGRKSLLARVANYTPRGEVKAGWANIAELFGGAEPNFDQNYSNSKNRDGTGSLFVIGAHPSTVLNMDIHKCYGQ